MSKNGSDYLIGQIHRNLEYCRAEFDMNYAESIGSIFLVLTGLTLECISLSNSEEDKDGDVDKDEEENNNGS